MAMYMYMHPVYAHMYLIYKNPKYSCLHKMTKAHLIRGGGRAGYGLNILSMWPQRPPERIKDFPGGAHPDPPNLCSYYCTVQFLSNKSCIYKILRYSPPSI